MFPYWFPTMGNETEQSAPPQSAEPPEQETQLAMQVGNLTAEVEMMRQDQAMRDSRSAPPSEQAPPAAEKLPATVLVYRDGHQVEVENYAIQGKTLWVFSRQATRQVPLADLDLAATQHVNQERGVDFAAPSPK